MAVESFLHWFLINEYTVSKLPFSMYEVTSCAKRFLEKHRQRKRNIRFKRYILKGDRLFVRHRSLLNKYIH